MPSSSCRVLPAGVLLCAAWIGLASAYWAIIVTGYVGAGVTTTEVKFGPTSFQLRIGCLWYVQPDSATLVTRPPSQMVYFTTDPTS